MTMGGQGEGSHVWGLKGGWEKREGGLGRKGVMAARKTVSGEWSLEAAEVATGAGPARLEQSPKEVLKVLGPGWRHWELSLREARKMLGPAQGQGGKVAD